MCVQQAISEAYLRMPQRQVRGRAGQAAVMRSILEPCNPTRSGWGQVKDSRFCVGSA